MLRIAILDTGINPAHRQVGPLAGGVRVSWIDGRVRLTGNRRADWGDEIGHGTAVAATVCDGLPPEAFTLLSVRVFGRRMDAPPECLAAGVRWAVGQGADLVNLSAGVPAGSDPAGEAVVRDAWAAAGEAGVTLVAPRASHDALLIPGALAGVAGAIGVEADTELDYGQLARRGEVLVAPPWARPLPPLPREKNFSGVSFAVAAVTNRVAGVRLGVATAHFPVEPKPAP
ncbi:MAG: S8 family serine peptidase [Acidobacteria bacterium]|nr:S8 family serine peptidase [Acidobacteriota bacterium]MXW38986.1 S8 family serine peptidase [Acidobacteriota bacterium]MYA46114.1 S8 family serine peptidase [Acidobacteriota bacterium]MYI38092.1 S8 family serine peptidase [Acidobacteriota bacterium]